MSKERPYSHAIDLIKRAGLRPTRQRIGLAKLLFGDGNRHVTAEQLHDEAQSVNLAVSLATVYNSLHQFTAAGLLREVVVEPGRSYFDTNTSNHHHFYMEDDATLQDIPEDAITLSVLPAPPAGTQIRRVDVVVQLKRSP